MSDLNLHEKDLEGVAGGTASDENRKYKIGETVYALIGTNTKLARLTVVYYSSAFGGIPSYGCETRTGELFEFLQVKLDEGARLLASGTEVI